jgi:hypothetical protein
MPRRRAVTPPVAVGHPRGWADGVSYVCVPFDLPTVCRNPRRVAVGAPANGSAGRCCCAVGCREVSERDDAPDSAGLSRAGKPPVTESVRAADSCGSEGDRRTRVESIRPAPSPRSRHVLPGGAAERARRRLPPRRRRGRRQRDPAHPPRGISGRTLRARLWRGLADDQAADRTLAEHESIFAAPSARDAPLGQAASLLHVSNTERWLRERLSTGPAGDRAQPPETAGRQTAGK